MGSNQFLRILVVFAVYLGLKYGVGDIGRLILYPVTLLVTFLHEFGHAVGALITGGAVDGVQINPDGSGFTRTIGGNRPIVLMGGYLGSAIFGNLLFYIGARTEKLASITVNVLAAVMLFVSFFWFNSLQSTAYMGLFALVLFFISSKTNLDKDLLMFFGLASIIYIIQDFNVGPSSDLEKYAEIFKVVPVSFWMYLWLAIAVILTLFNLRMVFKSKPTQSQHNEF